MPNIGLVYALSAGANSILTLAQSASSSSATSIGRAVVTPWPISERSTMMSPGPAAAVVSRNSRREMRVGALMLRSLGGPMDGGPNALICAAAANVRHRLIDVCIGGVRLLGEQGRRGHVLSRL